MFPNERQRAILELAKSDGRVQVTTLVERLSVAPETVRRDLGVLERQGQVHRVYGGAVFVGDHSFEPLLARRNQQHVSDKTRMARAAAELISELPAAAVVLLDSGSAPEAVAKALPDRELTVITNGLPVAVALAAKANVTTWCLGGRVRGGTLACVDDWGRTILAGLTIDLAFIGVDGLTVEKGLSTVEPAEATIKGAMVAAARKRVLLAHHTKIGRDTFCRFATLADIDVVITDEKLDEEVASEIENAGPKLIRA
jgi:DeoR family fructose operon transcriptional repressor